MLPPSALLRHVAAVPERRRDVADEESEAEVGELNEAGTQEQLGEPVTHFGKVGARLEAGDACGTGLATSDGFRVASATAESLEPAAVVSCACATFASASFAAASV